jgi:hypothetical protein
LVRRSKLYSLKNRSKEELLRNDELSNLKQQTVSLKAKRVINGNLSLQNSTAKA